MVFEKVKKVFSSQLGISEDEIELNNTFKELGIDSLEIFEIVMALEDEFEIQIPNEDIEDIKTIADIVEYIESKL
jgi:acyl carrier protein